MNLKLPKLALPVFRMPSMGAGQADAALVIRSGDVELLALKGKAVEHRVRVPIGGTDEAQLTEAIRQAVAGSGLKRKRFAVGIPTQDVLLRFFTVPVLPKNEWEVAIPFEARKFIPFKTEQLIWDYRVTAPAGANRLDVVFAGIQEEALRHILSAVERAGVEPTSMEPRSVGLARLVAAPEAQDFVCVADIEEGAAHLAIVRNGVPYLARDVYFGSNPVEGEAAPPGGLDARGQRLLSELSVSIDFFMREYPNTAVTRVYLFGEETQVASWPAPLTEVLRCPVELGSAFIARDIPAGVPLNFASAVGLLRAKKDLGGLDFLPRSKAKGSAAAPVVVKAAPAAMLAGVQRAHVMAAVTVVAVLLGGVWMVGSSQIAGVRQKVAQLTAAREDLGYGLKGMDAAKLKPVKEGAKAQLELLKKTIDQRVLVSSQLDALAKALPEGLWFAGVDYDGPADASGRLQAKLVVRGACYLNHADKEVSAIQAFEQKIRRSPAVMAAFSTARLGKVDAATMRTSNVPYRTFQLSCSTDKKL